MVNRFPQLQLNNTNQISATTISEATLAKILTRQLNENDCKGRRPTVGSLAEWFERLLLVRASRVRLLTSLPSIGWHSLSHKWFPHARGRPQGLPQDRGTGRAVQSLHSNVRSSCSPRHGTCKEICTAPGVGKKQMKKILLFERRIFKLMENSFYCSISEDVQ